eukprot:7098107-Alexandrium_andersonii.AAC.1
MEASRGAIGQASHELLGGPRRRDLPSRVLKGRDDEGCGLPLVVCRGRVRCGASGSLAALAARLQLPGRASDRGPDSGRSRRQRG